MDKHVLSVLVENQPGVLSRVAGLFSRRGYNIDSFTAGGTEDERLTRMTIVLHGDHQALEQIKKQLSKLIDVVKITELKPQEAVYRELALVKVTADESTRASILEVVDIFRGKVIDVASEHLTVEMTGDHDKVLAFIDMMKGYGIKEIVRTGMTALGRWSN
ncbi:acetolactate synthase small subunit [Clostridium formicaceticum]|uniref:Acetolactate synthase small subunit n=1 Tax=Clostridium formicaceticum TaxID=1497 RepID=A0AAC9WGI5_9CLOT|nr:acetolactate synthase small subunit [Clostridium formicaceticum]AOY76368.1 acetolactate synthase small subunit [Clostridium formicaceticum]ARE86760.1 Acetolactate synthase small subunit [Clostridium formicaceticum]